MSSFVNPLAALGGFQNQQLQRFQNREAPAARPSGGLMEGVSSTPTLEGFDRASNRGTRQHEMFLSAIRAQQQRSAAVQPSVTTEKSYGFTPTGGKRDGGLVGRYKLVQGADQALSAMDNAFRNKFGYNIKVNSGGRSYAEQARLYAAYKAGRGNLAAPPGKSVHNSGRAVDLGGAFQNARSREHRWLQANAGRWGFKWTGKNFKQFEPWHWEWRG